MERDESREEVRVESSGEGVPQARQDDGRNRRILRERRHGVREHLGHVPREGVPHRRPRELHDGERAFEGDEDERFARAADGARPRAAGVEKRLEQRFLVPFRDEVLGVPLHGGEKAVAGPLERLDEVVRRRRQRHEARREILHALVVARVHGRAFERDDGRREARERGRRPRPHDVRGMVLSGVRIHVRLVRNAARPLRRQVLPQRASERDVQRLKSATDAEDRRAELFRGGKSAKSSASRSGWSSRVGVEGASP